MKIKTTLVVIFICSISTISFFIGKISINETATQKPETLLKNTPNIKLTSDETLSVLYSKLEAINESVNQIKQDVEHNKNNYKKLSGQVNGQSHESAPEYDTEDTTNEEYQQGLIEIEQQISTEYRAFEEETIDPVWASKAESDLEIELADFGKTIGFDLESAKCKSTRCQAVIAFTNYEDAMKKGGDVAQLYLPSLNCSQTVSLQEPSDIKALYKTEILFDCTRMVQGLAQPLKSRI